MPRQVVQRRKKTVMQRYAHFLAHHPFLILTVTFCANIVLLLVIVCTDNVPTFDDPQAGFEPRGTLTNQRLLAWRNFLDRADEDEAVAQTGSRHGGLGTAVLAEEVDYAESAEADYETVKGQQIYPLEKTIRKMTGLGPIKESQGFFCSDPAPGHARLILQRKDTGNLLDLSHIRQICSLDRQIRRLTEFRWLAERTATGRICRTWNLPNCLAALAKKPSCQQLTDSDIQSARNLTALCLPHFRRGRLKADCSATSPASCGSDLPAGCRQDSNLIYHLLHFISDKESRENNYSSMKRTLALLPVWSSPSAMELYRELQGVNFSRRADDAAAAVEMIGIEMGLEGRLFDAVLLEDTVYMGIAAGVVLVVLWIYTGSLFVTVMNVLAVFFSLVMAYFLYVFVLRLVFFPFMNLLTCVIIVAIGADALVIYARLWHLAKTEKNDGRFEKVVHATFQHAAQAILVSSLTASAALFADIVNPVIAIRCFSIFAGLTVLVHFLFAVTWMPACFVIADKWSSSLYVCRFFSVHFCDIKSPACRLLYHCRCLDIGLRQVCDYFRIFFEKLLPCLVIRLKWMWIVLFIAVTAGACMVVFVFPALQIASGRHFALWNRAHPWEQYRLLKDNFAFEEERSGNRSVPMSLRFVWGVLALNHAALLDPKDTGVLVMDKSFDLSDPQSQTWMLNFCSSLKQQEFYDNNTILDPLKSICFMDALKNWMDILDCDASNPVCCKTSTFPYTPSTFTKCTEMFSRAMAEQAHLSQTKLFGPNFNSLRRIDSFVVHVQSSQPFSHSFATIQAFHRHIEEWFTTQLQTAPPGLAGGWFTGDFDFLDLQQSLITGTVLSLIVSLSVALLVLFFTTLNVGVSIIAIIVIAGIMLATIAALVLLDWRLNVFESTIIGLAIGLSVDFTLHYAVSYCCAEAYEDRELKTNVVIAEMSSSVTMSALTTFLAGALMIPSEILFYRQIGIFIILVISISLFYATVFFPACLAAMGPQGGFLQFHYPSCHTSICCRPDPSKLVEKSMHSSAEFDTTVTSGTYERDREKQYFPTANQPYHHKPAASPSGRVAVRTAEQPPKTTGHLLSLDATLAEEETDSVGELGSVPASRGPSRGASLIRRQARGIFPWDYIMQKLPLSRHFSIAGSSVIYIDADVRSVTSDGNVDVPVVLPNIREDVPEVWLRRSD